MFKRFLITLLLLACLCSCHYQMGHGELSHQYPTIAVPYVVGDKNGSITAEIIRQIGTSGAFSYSDSQGSLTLDVKVIEVRDENIGFRYDRKKTGKLKHSIIPSETRLSITVEVCIKNSATCEILRGPTLITAYTDFDHDYYSNPNAINVFSLGQLNDIDVAHDAALDPLSRKLAEKIVDFVVNGW